MIMLFSGESGGKYGYKDEFQPDGTFWYTGEGTIGDMTMTRGNAAIKNHLENNKKIHLFEYVRKGRVWYLGEASYLGHHSEERPDVKGNLRQAIVFELDVNTSQSNDAGPLGRVAASESALWKLPLEEVRARATEAGFKGANQQSAEQMCISAAKRYVYTYSVVPTEYASAAVLPRLSLQRRVGHILSHTKFTDCPTAVRTIQDLLQRCARTVTAKYIMDKMGRVRTKN